VHSFVTNVPNHKLRLFYARKFLQIKIGVNTSINMGCFFAGKNIEIGNNTVIARNCHLDGRAPDGYIKIQNNVSIAPECYILSMTHEPNSPTFEAISKKVIIEDYVWIGTRAMILPGVKIGKGAILGAGSTATKAIPNYSIQVGSPSKEIAKRTTELIYELNYFPYFNTDIT
jgi:acetyltransferase-like isoleucine patch superfamily enzyme